MQPPSTTREDTTASCHARCAPFRRPVFKFGRKMDVNLGIRCRPDPPCTHRLDRSDPCDDIPHAYSPSPGQEAMSSLAVVAAPPHPLADEHSGLQHLALLAASVARLNDIVLITEADPCDEPGPRIVFVNDA